MQGCFLWRVGTAVLLMASSCGSAAETAEAGAYARQVTALADRWVEQVKTRLPVTHLGSGLPIERNDSLEQNTPQELAAWREFFADAEKELADIPEIQLVGRPEWVTWHYLRQGLAQSDATRLCRNELWRVSAFGWVKDLMHLATLQPVGTDAFRLQALTRWRSVPSWVDQEIANLREGLRLGHTATQDAVRATIAQLDALLVVDPGNSAFMSPATRDDAKVFRTDWTVVIETKVWPALHRYRDFLRDEYSPRARTSPSLAANTNGLECYRATLRANTTLDEDPRRLFDAAEARVRAERSLALALGKKLFGEKARDWRALVALVRADRRYRFSTRSAVAEDARAAVARASAAIDRMVRDPPPTAMKIEPFPEFMQRSGPGGEYVPGADDGSTLPIFYFRDDPATQLRGPFESLVFHETLPGHHLQAAVLAQNQRATLHPITRVLWFSGPGEGWATYAESLAHELGLYSSDFEVVCALLSSTTPPMVADLGIQVMGWSKKRAHAYLAEAQPLGDDEQADRMVATITGLPGLAVAYPLGAMQFEQMRTLAEKQLGDRFDLREFHRVMLEDGRLPFGALGSKLRRWLEKQ